MNLIKVLWVDDQDFEEIENAAYEKGIDITHVRSFSEAEPFLQGFRFDDWSAIILDCYCSMRPNDSEDHKFLRKALDKLSEIRKGRLLPWYVMSRGTDQDFSTIIDNQLSEDRNLWDGDWEKIYYSKTPEDYSILFDRIVSMAQNLPNYKVRYKFKEVFNIIGIEELFYKQLEDIMFPVLKSLICPDEKDMPTPLYHYNQLRQAVECLFRSFNKMGLLPNDLVFTKTGVNLSLSSHYLSGNDAILADGSLYRYGEKGESIYPKSISKIVWDILTIANIESHTVDLNDDEKKQIEEYLSDAIGGKYVIYSMTMGLCSVLIWYKSFLLDEHFDKNKYIEKCKHIIKTEEQRNEYEDKIMPVTFDENGVAHCGLCLLPIKRGRTPEGLNIKLKDVQLNTDSSTKNIYPFFAKYDPV